MYKENDRADISQYRPISLLKNLSKVFEKILSLRCTPWFNANSETNSTAFERHDL